MAEQGEASASLRGTKPRMHGCSFRFGRDGAPTLVLLNGAESLVEADYWRCAAEGVDRGHSVLTVDGPGDGRVN